jgi:hypothetical protein
MPGACASTISLRNIAAKYSLRASSTNLKHTAHTAHRPRSATVPHLCAQIDVPSAVKVTSAYSLSPTSSARSRHRVGSGRSWHSDLHVALASVLERGKISLTCSTDSHFLHIVTSRGSLKRTAAPCKLCAIDGLEATMLRCARGLYIGVLTTRTLYVTRCLCRGTQEVA